jgi:hypothetical protein
VDIFEQYRIRLCWQNGLTLSQAAKRLKNRWGFENIPMLIKEWREMKRRFGCCSLPLGYLNGWNKPRRSPEQDAEILNQAVTIPMFGTTYGNWKGITGPGKQLREMLRKQWNS